MSQACAVYLLVHCGDDKVLFDFEKDLPYSDLFQTIIDCFRVPPKHIEKIVLLDDKDELVPANQFGEFIRNNSGNTINLYVAVDTLTDLVSYNNFEEELVYRCRGGFNVNATPHWRTKPPTYEQPESFDHFVSELVNKMKEGLKANSTFYWKPQRQEKRRAAQLDRTYCGAQDKK